MSTDRRRDWVIRNEAGLYLRSFSVDGEPEWTAKKTLAARYSETVGAAQAEYMREKTTLEKLR